MNEAMKEAHRTLENLAVEYQINADGSLTFFHEEDYRTFYSEYLRGKEFVLQKKGNNYIVKGIKG